MPPTPTAAETAANLTALQESVTAAKLKLELTTNEVSALRLTVSQLEAESNGKETDQTSKLLMEQMGEWLAAVDATATTSVEVGAAIPRERRRTRSVGSS